MRRRNLVLIVALVACDPSDDRGSAGMADAATNDAAILDAAIDETRMPFTTTGTTPLGSLDDIRFIEVGFLDGFCPSGYYVDLYRTNAPAEGPAVMFLVPVPAELMQPPTGTIAARAWLPSGTPSTDQVSFEIVHVDIRPTEPLRIAGRMRASTGGWNIDFSIDATTRPLICI
jgi:hypothetical protein